MTEGAVEPLEKVRSMVEKVFIIGISGVRFWSIFEKASDLLPHFTRLMARGAHGRIPRIPHASSEEMWIALCTGRADGALSPPIWEVVARAGRQAVAVNVPLRLRVPTSPRGHYASPADLLVRVEEAIHGAGLHGTDLTKTGGPVGLYECIDRRLEATARLLQIAEWEMLLTVLLDPGETAPLRTETSIRAYWQRVDEGLGHLLALAGLETTVMLIAGESRGVEAGQELLDRLDWGLVIIADDLVGPAMELGRIEAVDIAPTILGLLGVPIPEGMTGRVLEEVVAPGGATGLTEEESLLIQKHLMGLGYLG